MNLLKRTLLIFLAVTLLLGLCLTAGAAGTASPYDRAVWAGTDTVIGEKDGRYGVFTHGGRTWLPASYAEIAPVSDGYFSVKTEAGKVGLFGPAEDWTYVWLLAPAYDAVEAVTWAPGGEHRALLREGESTLLCDPDERRTLLTLDGAAEFCSCVVPLPYEPMVHSEKSQYLFAPGADGALLYDLDGKALLDGASLRAVGKAEAGGYVPVRDGSSGLYGVWSIPGRKLSLPCRYRALHLASGVWLGQNEPAPACDALVSEDGKTWSAIDLVSDKTVLDAQYGSISGVCGFLSAEKDGKNLAFRMDGTPVLRADGTQASNLIYADTNRLCCRDAAAGTTEVLGTDGKSLIGRGAGKVVSQTARFLKVTNANRTVFLMDGLCRVETDPTVDWTASEDGTAFLRTKGGVPTQALSSDGLTVPLDASWKGCRLLHDIGWLQVTNGKKFAVYAVDGAKTVLRYASPAAYTELTLSAGTSYLTGRKNGRPCVVSFNLEDQNGVKCELPAAAAAPSAWAADEVRAAIDAGILAPTQQERYAAPCTRLDFCEMLARMLERRTGKSCAELGEETGAALPVFQDTDSEEVRMCAALGIVKGVGGGKFAPSAGITRQDAAALLARAAAYLKLAPNRESVDFSDGADEADYAKDAVAAVSAMESADGARVMAGVGGGRFNPRGGYTREQSVLTLYRLFRVA